MQARCSKDGTVCYGTDGHPYIVYASSGSSGESARFVQAPIDKRVSTKMCWLMYRNKMSFQPNITQIAISLIRW